MKYISCLRNVDIVELNTVDRRFGRSKKTWEKLRRWNVQTKENCWKATWNTHFGASFCFRYDTFEELDGPSRRHCLPKRENQLPSDNKVKLYGWFHSNEHFCRIRYRLSFLKLKMHKFVWQAITYLTASG